MIEIKLPFPPNTLSPNSRQHWASSSRAKAAYKNLCYVLTRKAIGPDFPPLVGKHSIHMIFHPPGNYRYDQDNLVARMKSGLDGMALALGVDDRNFQPLFSEIGDAADDACVFIRLNKES